MAKNAIEIILRLKDQATKKLDKATSGLKSKFSKLGTAIKVGAVAALGLFAVALRKCIKAAADQEMIFAKLQQAVENIGMEWGKAERQIKNFAAALQKTTIYGDTETAKLLQDLIPYTNDLGKAMTGAKVAMDMAAAGLFDINTAGKYVGMAMQGNVEMLGRYIGELRSSSNAQLKNMTAAEKTAYALDLLKEKYGGMAQKELATFNGQMKQVKNYFGDIAEAIGDKFLPMLTTAGKAWAKWLGAKPVREVSDEMNQLVNRLNEVTVELGKMTKHRGNYHKVDELIAVTERERLALVGQIQRLLVKETEEKKKQIELDVLSEKQATLRETLQVKILKLRGDEVAVQLKLLEIEIARMKIEAAGNEALIKQIDLYYQLAKAKIKSDATEAAKKKIDERTEARKKELAAIEAANKAVKKGAEEEPGEPKDKKKKKYTKDQLIEMQKHTLTDPRRAEWARQEMRRRRRESILEKKDSPERRRKLAEIDAPTMSEELMEALHAQGGAGEGEKQTPKEPTPKEREAIRKGADSQTTKNETISKLAGYIETNSTTLSDILKICADAVDKLKEQQGDIDTLKTQVASLTEGRG